jgi:putative ABC transport system permease protein
MHFIRLAIGNLLLHKRRSLTTLMAVAFGFTALGIFGSIVNFIFVDLRDQAIVNEKLGHLTFAKKGYALQGRMEPEMFLWSGVEISSLLKIMYQDSEVALATPRLQILGLASNGKGSAVFISESIDPIGDNQLVSEGTEGKPRKGVVSLDPNQGKSIAIGEAFAKSLGVKQGDFLTLMATTGNGQTNAVEADIAKVYNTGNPATDDKFILFPLSLGRELYDTDGGDRIVVMLKKGADLEAAQLRITNRLSTAGYEVESRSWRDLSLFYKGVTNMFSVVFRLMSGIISLVVLLTLLNTMYMSVAERTREIGTLRAMGVRRKHIIRLFMYEGVMLAVAGTLAALPFLFGIVWIFSIAQFSFTPPVSSVPVVIAPLIMPGRLIEVFLMFLCASTGAAYFASRGAAYRKVVDALTFN